MLTMYKTYRKTRESLKGTSPQCVALDPSNPNRAYCGTFGNGLWKTDDGGETWKRIRKEEEEDSSNDSISNRTQVMSVSVSHIKRGRKNGFNTVYVGTEPAALYTSDDGGKSWQRMRSINTLKSSSSWSFPPNLGLPMYIGLNRIRVIRLCFCCYRGWSSSPKS